jgi:hypothetical protein
MPNGGKSFNNNSFVFSRKVDTQLAENTSILGSWPTSTKAGGIRPLPSLRYDGAREHDWQNPSSQRALRGSINTVVKWNSRVVRVLWERFAAM